MKQLFSLMLATTTLLFGKPLLGAPIELGASVQLTGQFANTGRYYETLINSQSIRLTRQVA